MSLVVWQYPDRINECMTDFTWETDEENQAFPDMKVWWTYHKGDIDLTWDWWNPALGLWNAATWLPPESENRQKTLWGTHASSAAMKIHNIYRKHSLLFCTNTRYIYRPQQSWGKVMFSQAWVILFTGGLPQCMLGNQLPQDQAPPSLGADHLSLGAHPPGAEHGVRYGQCVGGMHPTGMQYFLNISFLKISFYCSVTQFQALSWLFLT